MKRSIWFYSFFTTLIFFAIVYACRKEVPAKLPVITTMAVTLVSDSLVLSGGEITDAGEDSVTARGVCWNTNQNPTINDSRTIDSLGSGIFTSHITGLSFNTLYYVRAYATNKAGTAYGNELYITQWMGEPGPQVTDIDGNAYNSVRIGTQIWMKENLKTTHYRDGSAIPNITNIDNWGNLSSGAYCWYNNDAVNKDIFGAMYNWYAVVDSRNLCPIGWHVPNNTEWETLEKYVGNGVINSPDIILAGLKLREADKTYWDCHVAEANNKSGFSALPGGRFYAVPHYPPTFFSIGSSSHWWTYYEYSKLEAWVWEMSCWAHFVNFIDTKTCGLSVRCMNDSIP